MMSFIRKNAIRVPVVWLVMSLMIVPFPPAGRMIAHGLSLQASVWTVDALSKVFRASQPPSTPQTSIDLIAAKNEYRAAQIAIRSDVPLSNLNVQVHDLIGVNGQVIAASNVSARFVDYIELSQHTQGLSSEQLLTAPNGSMLYPDRITNDSQLASLAAHTTQPIWYSVYVPKLTAAGMYTGQVTLQADEGSYTVDVALEVYDIILPDTNETDYKVDNWFSSAGWDPTTWTYLEQQYGIAKWSNEWWTVLEHFADYMAKHRNNTIWLDPIAYLEPDAQIHADGSYTFDWSRFDRTVQLFIDAGAMKYLHGVSIFSKRDGRYHVQMLQDENGSAKLAWVPSQSTAANDWLNHYLPALHDHLLKKGWLSIFYQSGGDEPYDQQDHADNNWLYQKIHQLAPGVKTIEAHHLFNNVYEGNLDVYVVKQDVYDANRSYYQNRQKLGDEVWLYICNMPTGEYLTRNLDAPLAHVLLAQWYAFKNGLGGYLHWGFNYWSNGDVLNDADAPWPGDSWLVYPDQAGYDLFSSIRSEIQLEGIQDLELLRMLANNGEPVLAHQIAESLISGGTQYNTDPASIKLARKNVMDALTNRLTNDVFVDPLDHFEGIYRKSNGFLIDSSNPEVAAGDTGRLSRVQNTEEFIVYYKPNIRSFSAKFYSDSGSDVSFYVSGDDENWTPLTVEAGQPVNTEYGWFGYKLSSSEIPWGTNYLKLVFHDTNPHEWLPQLGEMVLTYGYVMDGYMIDPLNSLSNIYDMSDKWGIDSANAQMADGDNNRLTRLENTDQYIVYKGANIQSFAATFYSDSSDLVEFYASPDNVNWTLVPHSDGPVWSTAYGWHGVTKSASGIAPGMNYLKLVFKAANANHWSPQLGQIYIYNDPM